MEYLESFCRNPFQSSLKKSFVNVFTFPMEFLTEFIQYLFRAFFLEFLWYFLPEFLQKLFPDIFLEFLSKFSKIASRIRFRSSIGNFSIEFFQKFLMTMSIEFLPEYQSSSNTSLWYSSGVPLGIHFRVSSCFFFSTRILHEFIQKFFPSFSRRTFRYSYACWDSSGNLLRNFP